MPAVRIVIVGLLDQGRGIVPEAGMKVDPDLRRVPKARDPSA